MNALREAAAHDANGRLDGRSGQVGDFLAGEREQNERDGRSRS